MSHLPTHTYRLTDSRLANMAATLIHEAYIHYQSQFSQITCRAPRRFVEQDWNGHRADVRERLTLYRTITDQVVVQIRHLLADRLTEKLVWASMKAVYSNLIAHRDDWDLAETYFNSVTRRIFDTVGVDPQIEFVSTDFGLPPTPSNSDIYRTYRTTKELPQLLQRIITDYNIEAPFAHLEADCTHAAAHIQAALTGRRPHIQQVDMVIRPFYRGKGAYLIGRIITPAGIIPLALALLHEENGVFIDAILLDEASLSILFSFARSYFHVDTERPYDLVQFIRSLIPRKRVAEIYISLGYNKHGKTELYRDLLYHLEQSHEQFHISPGQRGMVMIVFNLSDYDLVFKLIKDRFAQPKKTTRQEVIAKYEMVFQHDRAGRLVDAQTFEHLQFERQRFHPDLLQELLEVAGRTVQVCDDAVIVQHAYVERRVTPLDLYLQEAPLPQAEEAIIEYGRAIKDMAATNIFPGDMLLKNFGVTRHNRIVFYDYDELRSLTTCNFRKFPAAYHDDDELASEPWFHVSENDVFPQEFLRFMGLPPRLEPAFLAHHADLLTPTFWQQTQARLHAGELISIRPYRDDQRLNVIRDA